MVHDILARPLLSDATFAVGPDHTVTAKTGLAVWAFWRNRTERSWPPPNTRQKLTAPRFLRVVFCL